MKAAINKYKRTLWIISGIQEILVILSIIVSLFIFVPIMVSDMKFNEVLIYIIILLGSEGIIYISFELLKRRYKALINLLNVKLALRDEENKRLYNHMRFEEFNRLYKGM